MNAAVLAQAVAPTARAVRWYPLPAVAVVLALLAVPTALTDRPADPLFPLAAAALAAVVVSALDDPAAGLLSALPTPVMARRLIRLALVAAPALVVWTLLGGALDASSTATDVAPLLALLSIGVAVAVWTPWARSALVGAAAPVAWFVADRIGADAGWFTDLAGLWHTDPWPVCAAAVLLVVAGRNR